jgi:cation:H+ antiporter
MTELFDSLATEWPWQALVLTMVVTIVILAKGADWLVENAVAISVRLGVPRILVGATVVSLGTTTPEAVVSVLSALQGRSEMALGNAVGSIICDTGLILGIACIIAPLPFDRLVVTRQGWFQFACGFLLVLACVPPTTPFAVFTTGGNLPQSAGYVFLVILTLYMAWSVALARNAYVSQQLPTGAPRFGLARSLFSLVAAVAIVVATSALLISVAAETADRLSIPSSVVAATLVAFGTSLPELIIVVTASLKGHGELAVGNVIGADILNVLFVAGAAAAVTPDGLAAGSTFFFIQFPAMLFVLLVFRIGIWRARKDTFPRSFGYVLLGTYIVVTVISFNFSGHTLGSSG